MRLVGLVEARQSPSNCFDHSDFGHSSRPIPHFRKSAAAGLEKCRCGAKHPFKLGRKTVRYIPDTTYDRDSDSEEGPESGPVDAARQRLPAADVAFMQQSKGDALKTGLND